MEGDQPPLKYSSGMGEIQERTNEQLNTLALQQDYTGSLDREQDSLSKFIAIHQKMEEQLNPVQDQPKLAPNADLQTKNLTGCQSIKSNGFKSQLHFN